MTRTRHGRPLTLRAGSRLTLTTCALAALTLLTACKQLTAPGLGFSRTTNLEAASRDGTKRLAPNFTTAAYLALDENTAEVYLSDIPAERFLDFKDDLDNPANPASGSILHIHVFLVPSAGNTPIDTTACNITFRHLVLTGASSTTSTPTAPTMGLYAGGGFLLLRDDPGDDTLGGQITGSSHRLTRATPNFTDLLGSGTLNGSFSAPSNDLLAKAMASKFELLAQHLPQPVIPEDADTKPKPKAPAAADKDKSKPKGK
jgi:hypothetical protein